jgi:hypothetical protein
LNGLASVLQTQINELGEFIDKKNQIGFSRAKAAPATTPHAPRLNASPTFGVMYRSSRRRFI